MTDKRTVMDAIFEGAWSIIEKVLIVLAKLTPPRPTYPPSRTAPLEQRIAKLEAQVNRVCACEALEIHEAKYCWNCGGSKEVEDA